MYNFSCKRNEALLEPSESVLVLIDIQERFRRVVSEMDRVIQNCVHLAKTAVRLGVPIVISEQYPEKLGDTVPEIIEACGGEVIRFPKRSFSALGNDAFFEHLKNLRKRQIVVAGIEAHVCVQQTVMDLMANSEAWISIVVDAISSRKKLDMDTALERMTRQGATKSTVESVLMEWVKTSTSPEFKEIQKLIK